MKSIAVLLNGPIKNDYRVIKTIETLSKNFEIHLFYLDGETQDETIFQNVKLYNHRLDNTLKNKFLSLTFFCYQYNFFINSVLEKKINFSYIWANDLPTLYPAYILARKLNAKLVYDSHEIYIETINQFFPRYSSFPKSIIFNTLKGVMRRHGRKVESKIAIKVNVFFTVNSSLANYFETIYKVKDVKILMNLPKLSVNVKPDAIFSYHKALNISENKKIVLYQGALNEGRGLRIMVEACTKIDDGIVLVILGNGTLKNTLKQMVKNLGIEQKVKFLDAVSSKELPSYTLGADFGINLLEDYNLSKKFASPNKLFEYIHAGIPIISSFSPENDLLYNQYFLGLQCSNDSNDVAKTINQCCKFSNEKITEIKGVLNDVKMKYNWENQESVILKNL